MFEVSREGCKTLTFIFQTIRCALVNHTLLCLNASLAQWQSSAFVTHRRKFDSRRGLIRYTRYMQLAELQLQIQDLTRRLQQVADRL